MSASHVCPFMDTEEQQAASPQGVRGIRQPSLEIPIRHSVINKTVHPKSKVNDTEGEQHHGLRGSYEWRQFQNWWSQAISKWPSKPLCTGSSQLSCLLNSLSQKPRLVRTVFFWAKHTWECSEQSKEFPGKYCFSFTLQSLNWQMF